MKKRVLIIVCLVILSSFVLGGKYLMVVQDYKDQVAAIKIGDINLAEVSDGSYIGNYDVSIIKAEVKVDVIDHKIMNIELIKHENGKGESAESIIPQVIEAQSVQVDTISGATNSSKVILKSIELALESGISPVMA